MTQHPGDTITTEERRADAPSPEDVFDLVVVGAGINGAGIARDAAARGLRVALVEKEDIGSGTSSWSGRLIHGGLRYLEQGDVRLVRESLRERELLFRLAPHLVKPVPLMIPFYRHNQRGPWMIRAGMVTYDVLSFDKTTANHKVLSREDAIRRFPGINPDGLQGCAIFMDGQVVWSERLCAEVALSAHADGARIFTHAKVDGFVEEGGAVRGVRYTDALTGRRHMLRARLVVNAAGPWVDAVLGETAGGRRHIGGAKGSHLIVDPFPGAPDDVIYYESRSDGRLVLVIPWGRRYLIGTTDKKFDDDPDTAVADDVEVGYLLGEVNSLIPGANLTEEDILYTYSGVRPLPYVPAQSEWKVPRSHVIHDHGPDHPGLLSIIGGKLTTYRSLAEETVDAVYKQLGRKAPRCTTRTTPFPGARVGDWDAFRAGLRAPGDVPEATVDRLVDVYGARAADILALGRAERDLLEPFDPDSGAIGAELVYTYETEFCRTLTDALIRRIMVGLNATCGLDVVERAARILAARHGWDEARVAREVDAYRRYVRRFDVPNRAPQPDAAAAVAVADTPTPNHTTDTPGRADVEAGARNLEGLDQ